MDEDIIDMVEGNPGAMQVMKELLEKHPKKFPLIVILLQIKKIRGSHIWIIYKLCNRNIDDFARYPFNIYDSS